jgi:putative PIG3 family NAD(P)H quinone oxidoreductase
MKAIVIREPGGPEVLVPADVGDPVAGPGEVLIEVRAAGVNRPDLMQRAGRYAPPPGASPLPGLEVAGIVIGLGPGVARWKPGDAVCALVAGGGYAERCAAPEGQCLPIPEGLGFVEAAALPETCFTVWTNVFEDGRLHAGESLLVHGGASGIGTTAIQMARARGAVVYATAGSDEKCRTCEALGARRAVNHRTEDFVEVLRSATEGRGIDVVLDMVGGSYAPRNIDLLAERGRLVQIATLQGPMATLNLLTVMRRRLTISGSTLRSRSVAEKTRIRDEVEREVWPLVARGELRPVIDTALPLVQAADAHRRLDEGSHVGKVVLEVGTSSR